MAKITSNRTVTFNLVFTEEEIAELYSALSVLENPRPCIVDLLSALTTELYHVGSL